MQIMQNAMIVTFYHNDNFMNMIYLERYDLMIMKDCDMLLSLRNILNYNNLRLFFFYVFVFYGRAG